MAEKTVKRLTNIFVLSVALLVIVAPALSAALSENTIKRCSNGRDDDKDGRIDCQDTDCLGVIKETSKKCSNGKDDDCDGRIDCQDEDCSRIKKCQVTPTGCTETDGGDNPGVYGTVTVKRPSGEVLMNSDGCESDFSQTEWYCRYPQDLSATQRTIDCRNNYGSGSRCVGGACTNAPSTTTTTTTTTTTINQANNGCIETDGGDNPGIYGTTQVKRSGGVILTYSDSCESDFSQTEWYCRYPQDLSASQRTIDCRNNYGSGSRCVGGACTNAGFTTTTTTLEGPFCIDYDNGLAYNIPASVIAERNSYNDACKGSHTVKEYFCGRNGANSTEGDCEALYGPNTPCMKQAGKGYCKEIKCSENDKGNDVFHKGTTKTQEEGLLKQQNTDSCIDSGNLLEWFCMNSDSAMMYSRDWPCDKTRGGPYRCVDGACVKTST